MRSPLMSLYRMIVCVTDGAEVGEGKARNCTITGVAWVRSQKYHRQSILAFVSCYIPKHRSRLFVLQVLVLMVGLCIVTVIVAVNDIRLKWLQCIYIYIQYIHDMTYWQNISSHIWGHEVAALGASTLTKVALLSVAQGKDIACSNLSGPSRVAICLYFLWCGWCSCDPLQGNPW